ncbi:MAG: SPOR domain-containing protein [Halioglobus sp.]
MKLSALSLLLLLTAGHALAAPTVDMGYDAFERGDVDTAVSIWRSLAEAGDSTAQLNLGQIYRLGKGVPADDREAVKWYSMAARAGSETAQYNLLLMQEEGRASQQELAMAFASEQNLQDMRSNESANDWLKRLPADAYVLQLVASSNKESVQKFIDKYLGEQQPTPQVIATRNQNLDWFIAVMGPYNSRSEANAVLATLPDKVLSGKPWIRPVSSAQAIASPEAR